MTVRHTSCTLHLLILAVAIGCGSAPKSAATGGAKANEPVSSGNSASSERENDAPAAGSEDAKPANHETPTEDKASIASGLQMLDQRSLTLDFDLNLMKKGEGKGVQSGNWSFSEERTLRVKTAKKDTIKELQVVYGKWEAKPLLGLTYEMPTDGKTYLLASDGSNLKITRGTSDHVTGEEERAVKAEYGWVGDRSPLREALVASKLEPGTNLGKSQALAQAILGAIPGADANQTELTATLEKVEGGAKKKALLKVEATTKIVSAKTTFAIELTGTAAVDVTSGWVVAADLSGTSQATGSVKHPKQGELEVSGKGKVKLTRKGEFR
jgi:hypothetical protein